MNIKRTWLAAALIFSASLIPLGVLASEGSKLDPRARIALEQLRQGVSTETMKQHGAAINAEGDLDVFISGTVSRGELEAAGAVVRTEIPGGIFTAFVPVGAIDAVAALPGVERIDGAVVCEEYLNASLPTTMADIQRSAGPAFTGANGAGILVGDIDSGISYAHEDFDDSSGNTRILRIWDQTATGTPPGGYTYGAEYFPADIDANTAQGKDTNGHGTHVMGIAAGDGSLTGGSIPAFTYAGVAPKADIVEVKSTYTNTQILDGAAYFFGVASALGKLAVLNISLGSQYGPHDGSSPLSVGLDALTGPGKAICVSAGNDGGTTTPISHRHARVDYGPTYPNPVSAVLTLSGTGSGRIVGVDGYYDNLDAVSLTISHPTYGSFGPYGLGAINATYPGVPFGTGTTRGYLYVENGAYFSASGDRQVYVEIRAGSTTGSTFNGNWTFTFTPLAPAGPANGRIDLWRFYSSTTAITANFSSGIDDTCLLGGDIATANNVITCGAWITKTSWVNCYGLNISYNATVPPTTVGLIASFSSPGPTRDGRLKPEIAAPGQGIGAALTRDVSLGTCSSSSSYYTFLNDNMTHWINQGTSMAAPHVTGAVALLFQKFGPLTKAQIMAKLSALALVDANTGVVPNNTWGAGKMRVDVTDPNVTVLYPNGSETLSIGTLATLTWSASDPIWSGVTAVDVQLSRDGGMNWEDLALGIPNSGSFNWNPTAPSTLQGLLRVRAHDVADNIGSDLSDAVFTIQEEPVAVAMENFAAENTAGGVEIRWRFTSASRYGDFWVERASGGPWTRLDAPVDASANGFAVVDATVEAGATYSYRVVAIEAEGATVSFAPITITASGVVTEFALGKAYPNPTAGGTAIRFSVPRTSHVGLKVYDVGGRLVSILADGDYEPGRYETTWDGRTRSGEAAPNGVYFLHLEAQAKNLVQRVTLLR